MIFNKFTFRVLLFSVFIALSGMLFIWTLLQDHIIVAKFTSAFLWLTFIISFASYVNRSNRDLMNFILTLKNPDLTIPVFTGKRSSGDILGEKYKEIINSINEIRASGESEYLYFRYLFDNASVGLLSYEPSGAIDLVNRSAKEILGSGDVSNITGFDSFADGFSGHLNTLKPDTDTLFRTVIRNEMKSIVTRKTVLIKRNSEIYLVSVQDISNVLGDEEIKVWQNLTSVLTHEIVNSVSPIKSLSGTLVRLAGKLSGSFVSLKTNDTYNDLISGLGAIDKRSKGLIQFVESYKRLSRIPGPVLSETPVDVLFKDTVDLLSDRQKKDINLVISDINPPDLKINLDEKLIIQALINLVQNSIYALEDIPGATVELSAGESSNGKKFIIVSDNGKGISPDLTDKIFIPFFTTRKEGSGIGLSVVRQIMSKHNGSVRVNSEPYIRTQFILEF